MAKQQPPSATSIAAPNVGHSNSFTPKTETFLIWKKSLALKVIVEGKQYVTIEVHACKDVNLRLAKAIARVQEQLIRAEVANYQGEHLYAYLLTVFDRQGWTIKVVENA